MFRGATLVNLDSKGRLAVPTHHWEKLNEESAGVMVCTIDHHQLCLLLYLLPAWEMIEQKLSRLSSMNPAARWVQRLLLWHARECQMDSTGRILLAPPLRQHAGLLKEVILVWQFNNLKLLDAQICYQHYEQVKDDIDAELSAELPLTDRLQDL